MLNRSISTVVRRAWQRHTRKPVDRLRICTQLQNRIKYRVLAILIAIVVVIMVISGVYGAIEMRKQMRVELVETLNSTGERAAQGLASAMWDIDQDSADMALLAELNNKHIKAIMLNNPDGEMFFGKQRDESRITNIDNGLPPADLQLSGKGGPCDQCSPASASTCQSQDPGFHRNVQPYRAFVMRERRHSKIQYRRRAPWRLPGNVCRLDQKLV